MSLVQSTMFSNHIPSSPEYRSHHRSKSFELLKVNSTRSKRSYSDDDVTLNQLKRCKTAPPSPPYDLFNQEISRNIINRSRSLSPNKKFINPLSPSNLPKSSPIASPKLSKVKLPSITAALNSAPITEAPIKLKPITPEFTTTSKDDHWRFELLNRITKQSRHFHLNQYNYLNKNDSRILLPKIHNYTYEVEQYPEYLELAQSLISLSKPVPQPPILTHKFVPITTPKKATKSDSSPKNTHHHTPRVCLSCGSDQSPCWRPSWSIKEGQLCNSCGLRYKKTSARCLNDKCRKIPAKGEWSLMQSKGLVKFEDGHEGHSCLECGFRVEVK